MENTYTEKQMDDAYDKGVKDTNIKRRDILIATLHGWKDYQSQGISIEEYVDEIESNL